MSYTKKELIDEAFSEIGIAPYEYDVTSDEVQNALRRMDSMMAMWVRKGIQLRYPLPANPGASVISDPSNVPDWANEGVFLNLAVRIAPMFGRAPLRETKVNARMAYKSILSRFTPAMEMQYPRTFPKGQGNKSWRYSDYNRFFRQNDAITEGNSGPILFTE